MKRKLGQSHNHYHSKGGPGVGDLDTVIGVKVFIPTEGRRPGRELELRALQKARIQEGLLVFEQRPGRPFSQPRGMSVYGAEGRRSFVGWDPKPVPHVCVEVECTLPGC